MNEDEKWMHHAIREALIAESNGEVPVGAVLVKENKLIAKAHNRPIAQNDPTLDAVLVKAPLDEGKVFALNGIEYDFDKSTLRLVSKKELNNLLAILKENKGLKIQISSYTDASRNIAVATSILKRKGLDYSKAAHDEMSKRYNSKLSQRRANSVVNYLINNGVSKSRLVAKGYGEENPIATNDTAEGRQANRRTEFKVLEGE